MGHRWCPLHRNTGPAAEKPARAPAEGVLTDGRLPDRAPIGRPPADRWRAEDGLAAPGRRRQRVARRWAPRRFSPPPGERPREAQRVARSST
jgi:hypothetical protein